MRSSNITVGYLISRVNGVWRRVNWGKAKKEKERPVMGFYRISGSADGCPNCRLAGPR